MNALKRIVDLTKGLDFNDLFSDKKIAEEWNLRVDAAAAELERLRRIEQAAREFVNADGRGDPPAKYQALKAAVKESEKE
jgi:hypothetical protein